MSHLIKRSSGERTTSPTRLRILNLRTLPTSSLDICTNSTHDRSQLAIEWHHWIGHLRVQRVFEPVESGARMAEPVETSWFLTRERNCKAPSSNRTWLLDRISICRRIVDNSYVNRPMESKSDARRFVSMVQLFCGIGLVIGLIFWRKF